MENNVKKSRDKLLICLIILVCLLILSFIPFIYLDMQYKKEMSANLANLNSRVTALENREAENQNEPVTEETEPETCDDDWFTDDGEFDDFDDFDDMVKAPVIYVYPTNDDTVVDISLTVPAESMIYAWPSGTLTNGNDYLETWNWTTTVSKKGHMVTGDTQSPYILWEAEGKPYAEITEGVCVSANETGNYLMEVLPELGLTEGEMRAMIAYWLPQMVADEGYNLIAFYGMDENDLYNRTYPLDVKTSDGKTPDSVRRVFMVWQKSDTPVELTPQTFDTFERTGFTVIEWGGTELEPLTNQ